jgi:hypothetical protein
MPIPITKPSRPSYDPEQLELVLDELSDILDTAYHQAKGSPHHQHLGPVITRGWEHVKLVVRRLEEDLAPLELPSE